MRGDADHDDELLVPGRRRLRERDLARAARVDEARAAIRLAGAASPEDLAAPSQAWARALADAVDVVVSAEWSEEASSPDGVGLMLLSATERGFQVDAPLYLLPEGTRPVRLEFDERGGCVIRVAAPDESSDSARRRDPRRPMRWALEIRVD